MSKKKTLLEEGTVRRFMKLANMEAVGTGFVNEMYTSPMADDEDLEEGCRGKKKPKGLREDETLEEETVEEMMDPMQDDEEMPEDEEMEVADLEIEDEEAEEPEEEVDLDAGDMGELTLSDEEAQVFLKVADKVRAAMEMEAPEELPAPDMGGEEDMSVEMDAEMDEPVEPADAEEEMEEEPMMEGMVNEVARRVARRLNKMKKSK